MKLNILLRYSLLAMILLMIQACSGCGKGKENKNDDDKKPLQWDVAGNLFKTNVWVGKNNNWLANLKMDTNLLNNGKTMVVVDSDNKVNPSNPAGTQLAKAVLGWMQTLPPFNGGLPFTVFYPDGIPAPIGNINIEEGKFVIVQHIDPNVKLGFFYAVAPKAANVETLEKTEKLLADLYYDMLNCAHKAGMEHIVLHAVSSGVFAQAGNEKAGNKKHFTQEEFLKMTFAGMKEGIAKFQKENPKHALRIILNNWDKLAGKKNSDIGKEVIKEVKTL